MNQGLVACIIRMQYKMEIYEIKFPKCKKWEAWNVFQILSIYWNEDLILPIYSHLILESIIFVLFRLLMSWQWMTWMYIDLQQSYKLKSGWKISLQWNIIFPIKASLYGLKCFTSYNVCPIIWANRTQP